MMFISYSDYSKWFYYFFRSLTRIQSAKIKIRPHFENGVGKVSKLSLPGDVLCGLVPRCNAKQCRRCSGLKQCNNYPKEYRIYLQEVVSLELRLLLQNG